MEFAKQLAIAYFTDFGFEVTEIPESNEKRADLDCYDDHKQQYIVEVKERLSTDHQSHRAIDGSSRQPFSPSNRIGGIMKKGSKQLEATPAQDSAFRLLFMALSGSNSEMQWRRALYTFYGVQDVTAGNGEGKSCIYFHHSFAFSSPSVDGLLIGDLKGIHLCMNEFSLRYDDLRRSRLTSRMGNAIYDPTCFADEGRIVLRSNVNRNDRSQVLNELEKQTGIRYSTLDLHRYSW